MDQDERSYFRKYYCERCNHSDTRKLKVNRLFSFLQRFGTKNKRLFENASTPSSSSINRFAIGPRCRWESIESALSSTTATSFAFVSAYHLQHDRDSNLGDKDETKLPSSFVSYGGSSYLQKKYNLLGYDATLGDKTRIQQDDLKRLARNSLADPENVEANLLERFDFQPPISRPVRHRSKSTNEIVLKSYCHRPGKRKAPPPPVLNPAGAPPAALKRIHCRKKRRAPLPPSKHTMEKVNSGTENRRQEIIVHNDSLKLEKGILKANKPQTETSYRPEFVNTNVSPKHWYKRSASRLSKTVKSLERKKSCAELLDEWMLEVGQPRSLSFHEFCQLNYSPTNESGKRKSQITMLANISELDREAAEILQKERQKKEHSVNREGKKYYEHTSAGRNTEQGLTEIKQHASNSVMSVSKEAPIRSKVSYTSIENLFKESNVGKRCSVVNNEPKRRTTDSICTESKNSEKEPAKGAFSLQSARPFSSWVCPQCTLENPSWKFICEACHKWRPSTVKKMSVSEAIIDSDRHIIWIFDDLFSRKPMNNIKSVSDVDKISKNREGNQQNKILESSTSDLNVLQSSYKRRNRMKIETEVNTNSSFQKNVSPSENVENEGPCNIKQLNFDYGNKKKQHFYTEKDRQKFREILKDLKDLFPEESFQIYRSAKQKTAIDLMPSSHEGGEDKKATDDSKSDGERKNSKMVSVNQPLKNEKEEMSSNATGIEFPGQKLRKKEKDESEEGTTIFKEITVRNSERELTFPATEAQNDLVQTHFTAFENQDKNETKDLPDVELVANFRWSGIGKQPSAEKTWICPLCTLINANSKETCEACDRRRDEKENPGNNLEPPSEEALTETTKKDLTNYLELVDLEQTDLIRNIENFECPICFTSHNSGRGVVLKNCLHAFCRECLSLTIEYSDEVEIKCPYGNADYSCESTLQEREIKALVEPHVFEKYLARSISEAENKIKNTFHCKTANCRGWCIYEDNVNEFHCPVCFKVNCLTCQAIHSGMNCKQYQEVINLESETNADANQTKLMLQEMLQKEDAMMCPTCHVILMKKWGCDWLRCTMCKTEICWVTRGPRWGPKGKGDTSGGCRCGVHGIKCHVKCTFCH